MKRNIALFVLFSLVVLSGNLMAQERKSGEVSFGGGFIYDEGDSIPFGGLSFGYTSKFIGGEVNGAYLSGIVLFGGNILLGVFDSRVFIPYATGGFCTSMYGGFGLDFGGGVKLKLSDRYAFRIEYRRYVFGDGDWGLNVLIGGISVFF